MEWMIMGILAAGVAAFFLWGIWGERKKERKIRREIHDSYGKIPKRKYSGEELAGIPGFYAAHRKENQIDEITWDDLGMDEIFFSMNHTYSSAGQEYLYYALHTPARTPEETDGERAAWFGAHEKEREELQFLFRRLGRSGKYSIYDYLMYLDGVEEQGIGQAIFLDLLLIFFVCLIPFSPSLGMTGLFVLLMINMYSYMKQKGEVEPYLVSFAYVRRILDFSDQIRRVEIPVLGKEWEELRQLGKQFGNFRSSAVWGMRGSTMAGDPLSVFMDYINMILHLDIIAFRVMLREVKKHLSDIDRMVELIGRTEAAIAVASWRESLRNGWCCPTFTQEGSLELREMYHPLLAEPVKNSIYTAKGVLVTGSNASGKSTFLRGMALNALLAQTVHTCTAEGYSAPMYRIFTSMSLRDDLESGESYYMVEIRALNRILDEAARDGSPVLCCVDEVLRGTNMVERIAASAQILKSLQAPKVLCIAATHDIELAELLKGYYGNYHFEEKIEGEDIFFPYRLLSGKAQTRNAIRLLGIMGYEERIIRAAEEMAARFVESGEWRFE